ncbi:hypothetical protein JMJ35_010707 [Cladonia borealis]|uniref:Heterokaryon incompatibility domain-containing protein n=1 Tax=Cladonia borealis TaxID=184061 RepID=A0AA39QPQ0_9LECA|nr:hypothetical protein JMJ35_010707 [Cladonia borealis]
MDNQSQLCPSCSSIDFKSAFALSDKKIAWMGVPIVATRKEVQADCILCLWVVARIFSDINANDRVAAVGQIGYHFRAIGSQWVSKRPFGPGFKGNSDVVVAIVRGDSNHYSVDTAELLRAISLGLILPLAQGSALQPSEISGYRHYRGRIVNSLSPDFTRIRSWIDECHSSQSNCHWKCKSSRGNTSFQSRVIDCWTRQIVPLTQDLEYLALSYVWGTAIDDENTQTSQTSGVVPSPAPQTIEDAMSIARDIGERYLWVDRYCIWRSENRHLQIQNMYEIYRNALSTIVPVEADSAGSGFRGVSSPRSNQIRFWTNAGLLVFTFPHISYQLILSIWLTRGWTYQEAFLSRSCIFFTEDQFYFACRSDYQSEDVEQAWFSLSDAYQETLEPKLFKYVDRLNEGYKSDSALVFYGLRQCIYKSIIDFRFRRAECV